MQTHSEESNFLFYTGSDGQINVPLVVDGETVWTSQNKIAEIFNTSKQNVSYHLTNIFSEKELDQNSVVKEILTTARDGKKYNVLFYNLDAIIAVGYRISSYQATQFRIWATGILKEYLIKGFAMDDARLKQGKQVFGKDYFDELLQRIKEIRASERRFYQKITDIYSQCSYDYDPKSPITQTFFATVQNKLEFAITHLTSAEIIKSRANSTQPNMGLRTWSNSPNGKILKKDVTIAKNYLTQSEIGELNSIVVMYLDFAELQAKRNKPMKMQDWVSKLDSFLQFNEYDLLKNAGKVKKTVADSFAEAQYEQFRVIQDREYNSDFDKVVEQIRQTSELPKQLPGKTSVNESNEPGKKKRGRPSKPKD